MTPHRIRAAWDDGRPALGIWLSTSSPVTVERLAASGVDYLCVDLQHGAIELGDLGAVLPAAEAAGASPVARIPANDPATIMRALDLGARGVIVPLVETAAQAAAAVAACRFPPAGVRSYGPVRAATVLGSGDTAPVEADPLCIVMVETRAGLERVEEIAATPGLDAIYIGPADLAVSLGLPVTYDGGPEHRDAVETIRRACAAAGVRSGIHCGGAELASRRAREGFDMITVVEELAVLEGARREVEAVRAGLR